MRHCGICQKSLENDLLCFHKNDRMVVLFMRIFVSGLRCICFPNVGIVCDIRSYVIDDRRNFRARTWWKVWEKDKKWLCVTERRGSVVHALNAWALSVLFYSTGAISRDGHLTCFCILHFHKDFCYIILSTNLFSHQHWPGLGTQTHVSGQSH